ncbi:MAG: 4Fe-4S binding protein [Reichenbachiella sp.]|uniref:4Fe-4S binding protein n=1 Tax=Reichenbachiella sp. TaxID=2184521 RepID=UPI002965D2CF|nr:4Fe-4S binding protein [Reichenbachiella sp.]MDW3209340.1 4Fe-4S binding protein [Reichenbachiella sp.]
MKQYFKNIIQTTASLAYGLKITMRHFWQARTSRTPVGVEDKTYFEQKDGIVTLQYPFEQLPVPDTGRYQLNNEIDDCIVCDKCAKVCPVNCIDIEPVRAVDEIGKTSDGTSKRIYAAKFDIDMSKCCFCGLCTVVCPTECLTMTKDYDFSVFDLKEHNFEFGEMSPELVAEKKAEFEAHQAEKEKAKAAAAAAKADTATSGETSEKPKTGGFKPKVKMGKPAVKKIEDGSPKSEAADAKPARPAFKPKVKPAVKKAEDGSQKSEAENTKPNAQSSKPVFKPKVKPVVKKQEDSGVDVSKSEDKPKAAKPVFKPKVKTVVKKTEDGSQKSEGSKPKAQSPRPVFRPKIKPKKKD